MTSDERTRLVLLMAASAGITISPWRAEEVGHIVERNSAALRTAFAPEPLETVPGDFKRLLVDPEA